MGRGYRLQHVLLQIEETLSTTLPRDNLEAKLLPSGYYKVSVVPCTLAL